MNETFKIKTEQQMIKERLIVIGNLIGTMSMQQILDSDSNTALAKEALELNDKLKLHNSEKETLKIEDMREGNILIYTVDSKKIEVRVEPILSWKEPQINVRDVGGGALNGRIFENVPLTKLTRKIEE